MTAAVVVSDLSKRYHGSDRRAVDGLAFSVAPGEVWGLLGPNGAGKTTALRMMLGLIRPDAGSTDLLGERVRPGSPVLHRVGALIERPAFIPHLRGELNLRLFWRAGGGSWPPPGLDAALDLAGLGDAVERKVKAYSQGMRQRLGIAQAMMGSPELLVLDEPTNGLDPGEIREIRRVIGELARTGVTVLLSSHLLSEVEQICSHAVVMDRGRLVVAGPVEDIIGAGGAVYLEVSDVEAALRLLSARRDVTDARRDGEGIVITVAGEGRARIVAALVRGGIGVETVAARRRLEDAFLELVAHEESS